jgi:hypothetical protein
VDSTGLSSGRRIEIAIENLFHALRDGGILVIAVVLLFLANLRAAFITLTAIPLPLLAAVLTLQAFGATINTMTLGGMAIAIGALVDDAVIDVENVFRRLRENALLCAAPRPATPAAISASPNPCPFAGTGPGCGSSTWTPSRTSCRPGPPYRRTSTDGQSPGTTGNISEMPDDGKASAVATVSLAPRALRHVGLQLGRER